MCKIYNRVRSHIVFSLAMATKRGTLGILCIYCDSDLHRVEFNVFCFVDINLLLSHG